MAARVPVDCAAGGSVYANMTAPNSMRYCGSYAISDVGTRVSTDLIDVLALASSWFVHVQCSAVCCLFYVRE